MAPSTDIYINAMVEETKKTSVDNMKMKPNTHFIILQVLLANDPALKKVGTLKKIEPQQRKEPLLLENEEARKLRQYLYYDAFSFISNSKTTETIDRRIPTLS